MSYTKKIALCGLLLAFCSFFILMPSHAFTADSLDITIDKNGDAVATFRFTLEGFIENAIPQSMLEEELKKGLTTSSDPPELKSMDKSSAVLFMKKFADTSDVPTGTEYRTASMDFKKAEIALENSALSGAVSADFSPEKIVLTFPDSFRREFSNVDVLPAVSHIVIDPSRTPRTPAVPSATAVPPAKGSMNVTSSPLNVKVYLDSGYIGEAPAVFPDIAMGTHTVEFRKEGFESVSKTVIINPGKTTNVMVVLSYIPLETTGDTSSAPGFAWIFLIIAFIAIAGGAYYFWSEKKRKEWDEEEDTEAGESGGPDPAARYTVPPDIAINDSAVKGTAIKDTAVKETIVSDREFNDTAVSDTIVKVTILRDIPGQETEDKDTTNTRE